ncbi:universal stress protein [Cyanobacterium sp. uoEpiScrs1]|uniref:universal stress protein n=1 Tax=Cyanobacterium sp. uoEpiScrs1 TaxID=2976343 RepID=UPI002269DCE1|nr:universal stress protein [Cyanobacterium sp. uoEpiScrs1]
MFHNCLICTDFTDGLHRLVDFIPSLANSGLKRIVFLHSISVWQSEKVVRVDEDEIIEAKKLLAPSLEKTPNGVEVKVEVLSGQPKDTILRLIDFYDIDIVLTGMSIRSAIETKIFGSHTLELVKLTSTPLMILRPQLISTYTCEELALRCQHMWRYLLIPYNGEQSGKYLLEEVINHLENHPKNSCEQCLLLWVIDDGGRTKEITKYHYRKAQEELNNAKAKLEALNITVKTKVIQGNPLGEILDTALNFDISAIAIASNYRNTILEWTNPSLANEVLRRSWFPVLFFSPKK